ncbi:hypothetical protein DW768_10000 [Ruminococcus sp. AM29-26]|nr:hypothetical protein DW768_10000 [Ruminococcus sp. AM29-26]
MHKEVHIFCIAKRVTGHGVNSNKYCAGYCQQTVIYVILDIRVRRRGKMSFGSDVMLKKNNQELN